MSYSEELARSCGLAAFEMKGAGVKVLDMRGVSALTDFIVICSASSPPHLKAIAREVNQRVAERQGEKPCYKEGRVSSRWVVLDYIDVMVHIMEAEMRERYDLESLWGDAGVLELDLPDGAEVKGGQDVG